MGSPTGFLPVALTAPGIQQSSRFLRAPLRMSITQNDSLVVIKARMPDGTQTSDEYTAGAKSTIPYGKDNTAERSVGWRGPVFVVTIDVKKGGHREDDFAIDDDGRLIVTTDTKGGRLGTVEIKRVYDRVRGAASTDGPNETGTPDPAR
jgi:hypothetical protein